eukprot:SAG31_NODE_590_length_13794_cov_22.123695_6_plen_44_part_00
MPRAAGAGRGRYIVYARVHTDVLKLTVQLLLYMYLGTSKYRSK